MKPNFGKWCEWPNRADLRDRNHPGIYAIRISKKGIAGKAFAFRKEIAYFGQTNGSLKIRIRAFHNVITDQGGFHGGADRFRAKYIFDQQKARLYRAAGKKYQREKLYVALWPFKRVPVTEADGLRMKGKVLCAEQECLATYLEKYRCQPEFNQTTSLKYSKQQS